MPRPKIETSCRNWPNRLCSFDLSNTSV